MGHKAVKVGLSEIFVTQGDTAVTCNGLGSCVAVLAFDPEAEVTGVVQIFLPKSNPAKQVSNPAKFADTAIPQLIDQMKATGAQTSRIKVVLIGGSKVMNFGQVTNQTLDLGSRNITASIIALELLGMTPAAKDVGGTSGRVMTFDSTTGELTIKTSQGREFTAFKFKEETGSVAA